MQQDKIYTQIPEGWRKLKSNTAPRGFFWIDNNKSFFDKEHIIALCKIN